MVSLCSTHETGFSDQGITMASTAGRGVTIGKSLSAVTTVDLIQTASHGGVYLHWTVVDIQVKCTDEVLVGGSYSVVEYDFQCSLLIRSRHGYSQL